MNRRIANLIKSLGDYPETAQLVSLAGSEINIVNLGYPKILAKIFDNRFGKNAFTLAKWLKEESGRPTDPDFVNYIGSGRGSFYGMADGALKTSIGLYDAAVQSAKQNDITVYDTYRAEHNFYVPKGGSDIIDIENGRQAAIRDIEKVLLEDIMFHDSFGAAILNGEVTDLSQYKKLSFSEASKKFNDKKVFIDTPPMVTYPNGWRWIDVGKKCELIRTKMRNCGGVSAMSPDPDSTMIALFDNKNEPHALVTYSPNQQRISGEVGSGESILKDKYSDYVTDLAKHLEVPFDTTNVKSKMLKLKVELGDQIATIERIPTSSVSFGDLFEFTTSGDGAEYYTDSYNIISVVDFEKVRHFVETRLEFIPDGYGATIVGSTDRLSISKSDLKSVKDLLNVCFNYRNIDEIKSHAGVRITPLREFKKS